MYIFFEQKKDFQINESLFLLYHTTTLPSNATGF